MISSHDALLRLQEGNRRFVSDKPSRATENARIRRERLVAAQSPFAIILGCSDSRVPAEIVFDQGLGDLFVIRVAGNVVTPSQIGSVEYAAEHFGTSLVVVLGHSGCGAVTAAIEGLGTAEDLSSPNFNSIVSQIEPTIQALKNQSPDLSQNALLDLAIKANVESSVYHLTQGSPILQQRIVRQQLLVIGAEYALDTGIVDFY